MGHHATALEGLILVVIVIDAGGTVFVREATTEISREFGAVARAMTPLLTDSTGDRRNHSTLMPHQAGWRGSNLPGAAAGPKASEVCR